MAHDRSLERPAAEATEALTQPMGLCRPLQLVIAHYHLNRGGVTQVIHNHLRSLSRRDALASEIQGITLLFGGRCQGWPERLEEPLPVPLKRLVWPALEYDSTPDPPTSALAQQLVSLLRRAGLTPDRTILHVHNHALGKNAAWTASIASLAQAGYRLLLQIHDFAEDFRPEAYRRLTQALAGDRPVDLPRRLYPQASQIHYAVLNGRDQAVLAAAGVAPSHLHHLPNPVAVPGPLPDRGTARKRLRDRFGVSVQSRFVLYPVRGISRKNLGELLLWSALEGHTRYAVTLSPLNVQQQPRYQRWQRLAEELQLPVVFGLGEPGALSLPESLAAADAVITTSVAEGFGMTLLESWLAGCPLIGRDLPEITDDFRRQGLQFPWLARSLQVPLWWIADLSTFHRRWADQVNRVLSDYGQAQLPPEVLARGLRPTDNGRID